MNIVIPVYTICVVMFFIFILIKVRPKEDALNDAFTEAFSFDTFFADEPEWFGK